MITTSFAKIDFNLQINNSLLKLLYNNIKEVKYNFSWTIIKDSFFIKTIEQVISYESDIMQ